MWTSLITRCVQQALNQTSAMEKIFCKQTEQLTGHCNLRHQTTYAQNQAVTWFTRTLSSQEEHKNLSVDHSTLNLSTAEMRFLLCFWVFWKVWMPNAIVEARYVTLSANEGVSANKRAALLTCIFKTFSDK